MENSEDSLLIAPETEKYKGELRRFFILFMYAIFGLIKYKIIIL